MSRTSANDAVHDALRRLDAAAGLGAVVARDDAAAIASADAIAARQAAGERLPFAGEVVTVKDWIEVAGLPCESESAVRTGRVPERDATVIARLRAAGAVIVAKTQPGAHHPLHGRCRHPLDPDRSPGASSSGEAALIGAGASTIGLGSDSGGSIRLPAAWCGVAGLKPSFGLVPDSGHVPRVGPRYDGRTVIGPMARSVADLWRVLEVIVGPDGRDPGCAPVALGDAAAVSTAGMRLAVIGLDGAWTPAASTVDAVRRAVAALIARGATMVDPGPAVDLDRSFAITGQYWGRRELSGVEIDQHLRDWDRFVHGTTARLAGVDVVVGPVVRDVAPIDRPLVGEDYVHTLPWSLMGWPAVSVPAGTDPATGLPLAVQVAAHRWHDHVAVAVAAWLETDLA